MGAEQLYLRRTRVEYIRCPFKDFGSHIDWSIDESSSAHLSITEALELGRLQLTIQRVKQEKRPVPAVRSAVPEAILKEVPEKALKGRSIANMVR